MACVRVVGSNVDRVGGHGHRGEENHLLPPRGSLIRKGGRSQKRTVARPEVSDVSAGIGARLVEADAGDVAARIRLELHPQLIRFGITGVHQSRELCRGQMVQFVVHAEGVADRDAQTLGGGLRRIRGIDAPEPRS